VKFRTPLIRLLSFSIEFSTGHHANTSHTFVVLITDDLMHLPVGSPKMKDIQINNAHWYIKYRI
jgi:hypothetical protein